jgi:hypothetical protein
MRSRSRQTRAALPSRAPVRVGRAKTTPRPRSARRGAKRALWIGAVVLAALVAAAAYLRDEPPRAARHSPPATRTSEPKTLRPAPSRPRPPLAPPPSAVGGETEGAGEQAEPGTELGWRALGLEPSPADAIPTGHDTGSVITPAAAGAAGSKQDDVLPEDAPEGPSESIEPMVAEPTVAEPTDIEPAPARHEARPSAPPPPRGHRGVDTGIVLTPAPQPEELE